MPIFPDYLPASWAQSLRSIADDLDVDLDCLRKRKNLFKFGMRSAVPADTRSTVWMSDDAHETMLAANDITHVSSTSAGDTTALVVEGHTISGTDLTFTVQSLTLAGQTAVALGTALARCTRMYSASATELVGDVYAHEGGTLSAGKPTDTAEIHARIPAGEQQTQKCATSISAADVWLVTDIQGYLIGSNNARAEMRLEVRPAGGVWRPVGPSFGLGTTGTLSYAQSFGTPIAVPPNSDVRMTAVSSATLDVSAGINGPLATVVAI